MIRAAVLVICSLCSVASAIEIQRKYDKFKNRDELSTGMMPVFDEGTTFLRTVFTTTTDRETRKVVEASLVMAGSFPRRQWGKGTETICLIDGKRQKMTDATYDSDIRTRSDVRFLEVLSYTLPASILNDLRYVRSLECQVGLFEFALSSEQLLLVRQIALETHIATTKTEPPLESSTTSETSASPSP